jgi:hypothetical protein
MALMRTSLLLIASLVSAIGWTTFAGCTPKKSTTESNGPNEAGLAAKDYFVTHVYPTISGSCGKCHSGNGGSGSVFLTSDAESSYAAIESSLGLISDPTKSPLVQHIHQDKNVILTPEERNVLTQWLGLEATARGLAGAQQRANSVTDAYKQFSQCMNFDIWEYYRMGDLGFTQTDSDGPCMGCHSVGQGSAWLSAGSRETFEKVKEFPYIQKLVVAKVDEGGNFNSLQPSGRLIEKSNEVCTNADRSECHPSFGLPPNVSNAITAFVNTTLQNLAGGTCQNGPTMVPEGGASDGGADGN